MRPEFLLLNPKNLLRLHFNINKFHIKYITDMIFLQICKSSSNRNKKNVVLSIRVSIKC